jgi:CPA2 family monovalent cation:H+ antiporter-2
MSEVADPVIYKDSLIILTVAGVIVPLMHRLRIHAVIAFLTAGALLGPYGLSIFADQYPLLSTITISNKEGLTFLGDLGIVFLLFLIGVELSVQRLITMRYLVFGMGGIQVALSTMVIAGVAILLGLSPEAAFLVGAALGLSSTAIVIQVLSQQKKLNTSVGRASFSVLLFQDLAVIPLLFLIAAWSHADEAATLLSGLGMAVVQALVAIGCIAVIGRLLMRPLFREVAATDSAELFVAATLLIIITSALMAATAGMSMALGAFVAGLLIAETEYSRVIRGIVEPFKGLLLGIFFFTVGMEINIPSILGHPFSTLSAIFALIALKILVILPVIRLFGFSWSVAVKTALLLAPAGEFAFVIIGLAAKSGIVGSADAVFALAVSSLSMAMIPFMPMIGNIFDRKFFKDSAPQQETQAGIPKYSDKQAIVIGYGRVGQLTCEMLDIHGVRYMALDKDASVVTSGRKSNGDVYYGDALSSEILKLCGIETAQTVIVTCRSISDVNDIIRTIRTLRADIQIISRAHDRDHARQLYALGATEAVPETIEASLQLSEAMLVNLGVSQLSVMAAIHEKREQLRRELRQAVNVKAQPGPQT